MVDGGVEPPDDFRSYQQHGKHASKERQPRPGMQPHGGGGDRGGGRDQAQNEQLERRPESQAKSIGGSAAPEIEIHFRWRHGVLAADWSRIRPSKKETGAKRGRSLGQLPAVVDGPNLGYQPWKAAVSLVRT